MKASELINYRDYIESHYWVARKELFFATHPRKCEVCGHPDVDLHHLVYGQYGKEADKNLAPLCRFHHEELHGIISLRKNMFYQTRLILEELKTKWEEMFRK